MMTEDSSKWKETTVILVNFVDQRASAVDADRITVLEFLGGGLGTDDYFVTETEHILQQISLRILTNSHYMREQLPNNSQLLYSNVPAGIPYSRATMAA